MNKSRHARKKEHLLLALQGTRCSFPKFFKDVMLPHDALTTVNPQDVQLQGTLCGFEVKVPLIINAITGGALVTEAINRELAKLAAKYSMPMAVGSQMAGIKSSSLRFTYQVARKYNPHGFLMGNLSASATPQQAQAAVEMLEAQALQLHLNPAQEGIMPEGDLIPPNLLENIAEICAKVSVPVIVKEVGFGLLAKQARKLSDLGVRTVDISGKGGTNFAQIEGKRNQSNWWEPFTDWGWPTPLCIADVSIHCPDLALVASGGITHGLDAAKALALGADSIAVAGKLVAKLCQNGFPEADEYIHSFLRQLRIAISLTGSISPAELRSKPLFITGKLAQQLKLLGVDPGTYSSRGR